MFPAVACRLLGSFLSWYAQYFVLLYQVLEQCVDCLSGSAFVCDGFVFCCGTRSTWWLFKLRSGILGVVAWHVPCLVGSFLQV